MEGYGQTECVSAATVNTIGDFSLNNVGVPLNACCLKLIDVPDMNYWVSKGKGEVLIKGSIVFKGYYKDPKKTSETIDKDGWLHTGDIGTFNMVCQINLSNSNFYYRFSVEWNIANHRSKKRHFQISSRRIYSAV